jgi:FG-GAP-like repeat
MACSDRYTAGDLNGDGRTDAVICEFAKWTGGLSWWAQQATGEYTRHPLRLRAGATRSYIYDWNQDGWPDVVALFAQGDEGIFLYTNDGKGNFRETQLLQFPPSYGSSSFRLFDFNADGRMDVVYTCGDNADYKGLLKPYHGIRVFVQGDDQRLTETLFLPLHGAYDAIPADFDMDGDIDLAAVAFFPDFQHNPNGGFVYFECMGDRTYSATTFPEVQQGRWMVMDAGDLEGDGDIDIVLGPLTFEVVPDGGEVRRWVDGGIPFILLENTRH